MLQRFTGGEAVRLDVVERGNDGIGCVPGFRSRGEQWQIVESGGDPSSRIAAGLELGEHRLRAGNHGGRQSRELSDRDPVAAVGSAVGDFVQQDEIALPFARPHVVQRECVEAAGEARQLVVVSREQSPALQLIVHGLDHGPGNRKPVIGRSAAADLVEDDEALLRRLGKNGGGLDHLDHEGRAAAGEIIRRADAAEQAIDDPNFGAGCRDERSCLGEHCDERGLP